MSLEFKIRYPKDINKIASEDEDNNNHTCMYIKLCCTSRESHLYALIETNHSLISKVSWQIEINTSNKTK